MRGSRRKEEKNELIKVTKDIARKMEDFCDAVQALKDIQEGIDELDEQLSRKESELKARLDHLEREFAENKLKAINTAVQSIGKVLINAEELDELKTSLSKLKATGKEEVTQIRADENARAEATIANALAVQKLEHECATAELKAQVNVFKNQVDNLTKTLQRMSEELESQKKLTADVAGIKRASSEISSQRA